jgi:hypothetical protein
VGKAIKWQELSSKLVRRFTLLIEIEILIKKFIGDKEWLTSIDGQIFTTKVTYGQSVFLTRQKAEKLVDQIKGRNKIVEEQERMTMIQPPEPEYEKPQICESCGFPIDKLIVSVDVAMINNQYAKLAITW